LSVYVSFCTLTKKEGHRTWYNDLQAAWYGYDCGSKGQGQRVRKWRISAQSVPFVEL